LFLLGIFRSTQALGLISGQLHWISDASRSWSLAPEISPAAEKASAAARDLQSSITDYRRTLARDSEQIRRIENEAWSATESQG